jgi:hypothetical protein
MKIEEVLANIEIIRNELRDMPEDIDRSYEQRLLYLDTQLSVCGDYLASFVWSVRKNKELKERAHEAYKDRRMLELMEEDRVKWKTVSKAEAKAKGEPEYLQAVEDRAEAIARDRLITEKISSVARMSNSISRNLNALNTEKIKFNG